MLIDAFPGDDRLVDYQPESSIASLGPVATESAPRETVIVIGAGVVGLCVALEAQRSGYRVTLIDRDQPGLGASFGNAGYLATELIDPLATPATLLSAPRLWLDPNGPVALPAAHFHRLLPWLARFILAARPAVVKKSREALSKLNQSAIPAWRRCLADLGSGDHLLESGSLLAWESGSNLDAAKFHADFLARWNVRSELVMADELADLEPALAGRTSHALHLPDGCQVRDPYRLCQSLFEGFIHRGGEFRQQTVARLGVSEQRVSVNGEGVALDGAHAILCAGAWSRSLLRQTGIDAPLEAERGYHLNIENPPIRLLRPVIFAERRFVLSPLDSGLRVVGISEMGGLRLKPLHRRFSALRYHSQSLLPELRHHGNTVTEWMGHRPTLPDSLPVIDRHPGYPRLLMAFGHQHLGLTQAAISAELVISMLRNGPGPLEVAPFRVERFRKF